jgi:hypothetical protein
MLSREMVDRSWRLLIWTVLIPGCHGPRREHPVSSVGSGVVTVSESKSATGPSQDHTAREACPGPLHALAEQNLTSWPSWTIVAHEGERAVVSGRPETEMSGIEITDIELGPLVVREQRFDSKGLSPITDVEICDPRCVEGKVRPPRIPTHVSDYVLRESAGHSFVISASMANERTDVFIGAFRRTSR